MPVTPTTRLLLGLLLGLAAGVMLPRLGGEVASRVAAVVEPVGVLWVNAVRMTVIPMVVSLLVVGIAGTRDTRAIGRIGGRGLLACVAMLGASAVFVAIVTPPLLALLPLDPAAVSALRAQASADAVPAGGPAGLGEWL